MCFKGFEECEQDNNFFNQAIYGFFEKMFGNFKLFIFLFAAIINIIQYYIFDKQTSAVIMNFLLNDIILRIANVKIITHGNTHYLNDSNMLVMSNHYDGLDGLVFLSIMNRPSNKLYMVAKSDVVGNDLDKNAISYALSFIKKSFMESSNLISYKRGDKESGEDVKNNIAKIITNDNENVLVFPEGTTHRNGVLKEFKNGIFHLASDENITILPVTLIYDRPDFGFEKGEEVNLLSWFNITCNVHVHEKIRGNNWEELKQQTFNTINDANTKNK